MNSPMSNQRNNVLKAANDMFFPEQPIYQMLQMISVNIISFQVIEEICVINIILYTAEKL